MKNGSVIERDAVHLAVSDGVGPIFCSSSEADKILYAFGSFGRKQRARQFAGSGIDDCGRSRRTRRGGRLLCRSFRGGSGLRAQRNGKQNHKSDDVFAHILLLKMKTETALYDIVHRTVPTLCVERQIPQD